MIKLPEVDTYVVEFAPGQDRLVDVGVAEPVVVVVLVGVTELLATLADEAVLVTSRAFHTPLFTALPQEDFI